MGFETTMVDVLPTLLEFLRLDSIVTVSALLIVYVGKYVGKKVKKDVFSFKITPLLIFEIVKAAMYLTAVYFVFFQDYKTGNVGCNFFGQLSLATLLVGILSFFEFITGLINIFKLLGLKKINLS